MPAYVGEIMSKPVVTIDESKNAKAAGELMKKERKYALVVLRKNKPIGIITDSDLIKKVVAKNLTPSSVKVSKIMSKPLVTIPSNESVAEAARKMKRNNMKRLVVVDGSKLVGILSSTDIARVSPELNDILEFKLNSTMSEPAIKEKFTSGICENCGNYSSDLRFDGGQWICEECRGELEE
jgi:CBS domain-containing protein